MSNMSGIQKSASNMLLLKRNVPMPMKGYIYFLQQLVCYTFLDPTHVRHGVVVYTITSVKLLAMYLLLVYTQ